MRILTSSRDDAMIACTRDFPWSEDGANNFAPFVCRVQYDTPLLTTQADAYNALLGLTICPTDE